MLNTIDEIHKYFYHIDNLYESLKEDFISFYYIELEHIGLTDDLYIKMNARGKLLTSFEIFKSGLEQKISDNKWEDDINVNETFSFIRMGESY